MKYEFAWFQIAKLKGFAYMNTPMSETLPVRKTHLRTHEKLKTRLPSLPSDTISATSTISMLRNNNIQTGFDVSMD